MPLIPRFDTPAFVQDAPPGSAWYAAWSKYLDLQIKTKMLPPGGDSFFNPVRTDAVVAGEKFLTWMAFPRTVLTNELRDDRMGAFRNAEPRLHSGTRQDEYFEWYAYKDKAEKKITRVVFVTETPEYYEQLWAFDRALVVDLYRAHVSLAVVEADLHVDGKYQRENRWNVRDGIMHYIMSINTLDCALRLVIGAADPNSHKDNFQAPAGPFTAVDPRAANDIKMLARKGLFLTLTNPIGLYIAGWNDTGFTKPDGSPAGNYWRIVRGTEGMALRVEYAVPASEGFVVGDMKIGGHRIEFGGQLAEHITVKIGGLAAGRIR